MYDQLAAATVCFEKKNSQFRTGLSFAAGLLYPFGSKLSNFFFVNIELYLRDDKSVFFLSDSSTAGHSRLKMENSAIN